MSFRNLRFASKSTSHVVSHLSIKPTCALLRFDQPCGPLDAHNEAPSHLGIQGATVPRLLHPQDAPDPRNHLVGGWVGGFVEVNKARPVVENGREWELSIRADTATVQEL